VRPSLEPGWLEGTLNGKTGLVPENYVEFLPWHASCQVMQCQLHYSPATSARQSPSKWICLSSNIHHQNNRLRSYPNMPVSLMMISQTAQCAAK